MARRALHLWQRLTATRIGMQDAEDHGAEHLYKRQLLVGFVALKAFVVSLPKNPNRRYRTPRYYPIPTHSHARSANARALQAATVSAMSGDHPTHHPAATSRVETGAHVPNWTPAPAGAYRMQRSIVTTPSFNPVTYARGQLSAHANDFIQQQQQLQQQGFGPSPLDHARASASAAIAHSMQARTYDGTAQRGPRGRSATPWDDEDDPKRIKVPE